MKPMLKCLVTFIFLHFITLSAYGQTQVDSNLVERYLLDFSVPDMPAFKALDVDPSNLLRPSEVKKFAVMISPFYSNGNAVIPKNFSLEFAPWKIASGKWTLDDYSTSWLKRFRYNSAFSIGTIRDSGPPASRLALGYRVSILSKKADIYRSALIRNYYYTNTLTIQVAFDNLRNDWVSIVVSPSPNPEDRADYVKDHLANFQTFFCGIKTYLKDHPNTFMQQHLDDFLAAYKSATGKDVSNSDLCDVMGSWNQSVNSFIDEYKKKYWNATRLDLALAWVGQSNDTLIKNTAFSSFSIWAAYAIRLGDAKQLVIGVNPVFPRSENKDSLKLNFAGNMRFYLGTQDFRGFLESQFKYKRYMDDEKSLLINLGAEFRLGEKFWIMASAGINNYLKEKDPFSKLVSNIDVRYFFDKQRK